jgi:hypothetical protein
VLIWFSQAKSGGKNIPGRMNRLYKLPENEKNLVGQVLMAISTTVSGRVIYGKIGEESKSMLEIVLRVLGCVYVKELMDSFHWLGEFACVRDTTLNPFV